MRSRLSRWPPALRILLGQLAAFGLLLAWARLGGGRLSPPGWVAAQALLALGAGFALGLPWPWALLNLAVSVGLDGALRGNWPLWVAPAVLAGLLVLFGGGLSTRVPLYHSSRDAWARVADLVPEGTPLRVVDLGAGFGGLLAYLARVRPEANLEGVEASPLTWAVAALRCLPCPQIHLRFGSLWKVSLTEVDVAFAFLSPVPMPDLWVKVRREMRPGTLFISHSFAVPGVKPDREIPVKGRRDAKLYVYFL